LLFNYVGLAQQSEFIRSKYISTKNDTTQIDTCSIIPGSLIFIGDNKQDAVINYADAKIYWTNHSRNKTDSVQVVYKVYSFSFNQEFYKRKRETATNFSNQSLDIYKETPTNNKENIFGLSGFNKSGSIARGVSIGNNQDPIVNSSLNLQLSGKLANGIEIVAAITDDNIPIQADGNTQQLQEFDKVFIQLSNENNKVIVGKYKIFK
jgi:hypothetical protein